MNTRQESLGKLSLSIFTSICTHEHTVLQSEQLLNVIEMIIIYINLIFSTSEM